MRSGVYALIDPRDSTIRYVGSSVDMDRRYREHCCNYSATMTTGLGKWLRDLKHESQAPGLVVLRECSEPELTDVELHFIEMFESTILNMDKRPRTQPVGWMSEDDHLTRVWDRILEWKRSGLKDYDCTGRINAIRRGRENPEFRIKCLEMVREVYGYAPSALITAKWSN